MSIPREDLMVKLSKEASQIYDSKLPEKEKKMLVIVPDLRLSGAMTVMKELLELALWEKYEIYMISSEDGEYREKMLQMGVNIIIRPYVYCSEEYREVLRESFDLIFVNSAGCYYYVYYFLNTKTKVLWWFHETKTQLEIMQKDFLNLSLLSSNIQIAGVTPAVQEGVQELYGKNIKLLSMPIQDKRKKEFIVKENEQVIFFIPAALTSIKGQDLLIKAITMLPEEFQKKSKFYFCGYSLPGQKEYGETICKAIEMLPNAEFLGSIDKSQVYEWYEICDCVLAPSRVDATPTTIVEAMMFQKLCIVSDATGISKFMQDCVNGFVFPSENVQELLKRILLVIAEKNNLSAIAQAGRYVYEDHFSTQVITEQLKDIII
ncbi:MAG: glycosyltransferase family 4 protein [Lachnospiraceae bacterium]|nr:glycosyltransferase family 4 protein [Lachnospiraceae bacterium]